jgi:hypothetical protein
VPQGCGFSVAIPNATVLPMFIYDIVGSLETVPVNTPYMIVIEFEGMVYTTV